MRKVRAGFHAARAAGEQALTSNQVRELPLGELRLGIRPHAKPVLGADAARALVVSQNALGHPQDGLGALLAADGEEEVPHLVLALRLTLRRDHLQLVEHLREARGQRDELRFAQVHQLGVRA